MSYAQNISIIRSYAGMDCGAFDVLNFYSNGHYIRGPQGELATKVSDYERKEFYLFFDLTQEINGVEKTVRGHIKDDKIAKRIIEYLNKYYMEYRTNCAAFANFLITGNFVECIDDGRKGNLVVTQKMTTYTGQKVEVGDMVCVMYYSHTYNTRKEINPRRGHYRRNKAKTNSEKCFLEMCRTSKRVTLPPDEIKDIFAKSAFKDFHFLVCVGHHEGEPIFIQQIGRNWETGKGKPPIILSIGGYNSYAEDVPCVALIRRAKNRN